MPKAKIERKDLIRNSLSVFKEKGYSAATMNDIASANGLLKGSIYHYVKSKESLMEEVLSALREHYNTRVFSIAYDKQLSPTDRIKEMGLKSEEIFMDEDGGDFFVNIALETDRNNPQFLEIIQGFFQDWIKALSHLYAYAFEEKEAHVKAELTVAEIEGAVILMKILQDPSYLHRTNLNIIKSFKSACQNRREK